MNRALACSVWLLAAVFPAAAAPRVAEIRWNELAALIVGHHVTVPLPGGDMVQGEALSVRDDSLLLDVTKASGSSRYPKGQTPIPRASITEVRLTERRGSGGRILGTVVGAIAGVVAGAEIVIHARGSEGASVSGFTAVAMAGAVGGYFAGRSADRHTRVLRVALEGDVR